MNKSQLKEIIKSAFTEIKVIRTMSNEEAYNKCLDVLGPMATFNLTAGIYDTLEVFLNDWYGKEEFEDMFSLNYQEFEPIAKQAIQTVKVGDVEPITIFEDDYNDISNFSISGFDFLSIIKDDIYNCVFVSKFPLKY